MNVPGHYLKFMHYCCSFSKATVNFQTNSPLSRLQLVSLYYTKWKTTCTEISESVLFWVIDIGRGHALVRRERAFHELSMEVSCPWSKWSDVWTGLNLNHWHFDWRHFAVEVNVKNKQQPRAVIWIQVSLDITSPRWLRWTLMDILLQKRAPGSETTIQQSSWKVCL